jgi:cell wall-associated NlpC family hydrolase
VFFAGSDGTTTDPGHVGLVIGNGKMIEAYATGFPIRVASYVGRGAIGFTEPWGGAGSTTSSTSTVPSVAGVPAPGMVVSPSSRASG